MNNNVRLSHGLERDEGKLYHHRLTLPITVTEESFCMATRNEFVDRAQFYRCCFCQDAFKSTEEFHEHLLQCGNKTDRCPNCRQYVRRAIFTYHYENDCAEIELNDGFDSKIELRKDKNRFSNDHRMNFVEKNENHQTFQEMWPSETHDTNSSGSIEVENRSNDCFAEQLTQLPEQLESIDSTTDNSNLSFSVCQVTSARDTHQTRINQHRNLSTLKKLPDVISQKQLANSNWKHCRHCNSLVVSENLSYHEKYCEQNPNHGFDF